MQQEESDKVSCLMKALGFGRYKILSNDIWTRQHHDIGLEGI